MLDGKLNDLATTVNTVARVKGFWESMEEAIHAVKVYGEMYQPDPKIQESLIKNTKDAFISQKVALVMAEGGETLEAMREGNYGLEKKDTFEDEIADQIIRLLDLCGELEIDIEKQIEWKLAHNKTREPKHVKQF